MFGYGDEGRVETAATYDYCEESIFVLGVEEYGGYECMKSELI